MPGGEKFHFCKCLNGLIDVATPIIIDGEHIANLASTWASPSNLNSKLPNLLKSLPDQPQNDGENRTRLLTKLMVPAAN